MARCVINLGGEGEVPHALNVNLPVILEKDWVNSRGTGNLETVKQSGPVVTARGNQLPFPDGCATRIITNSVPIDCTTWLGSGYISAEIARIQKR